MLKGLKKLLGREGKVTESGPDDKIFVNFVDHGGPGVVCFPDSVLHAEDLHSTIKSMHANKRYKQMVIYMEACFSGSMFDKLLESNINVLAITAANPNEESAVCYYDNERQTFLGDVYSVSWMEDSDRKISNLKVADFQGNLTSKTLTFSGSPYQRTLDAVPVSDVKLEILRRKMLTNTDNTEDQIAYEKLLKLKQETEDYFKKIVEHVTHFPLYEIYLNAPLHFTDFKCYRESLMLIRDMCPGLGYHKNDYISKQLKVIANMCDADIPAQKIWAAIGRASYDSNICIQST